MIPSGVQVFVALEPIDMRCYAERGVMRSWAWRGAPHRGKSLKRTPHNQRVAREGRSEASSLSGARKRPRRSVGGSMASIVSSFSVGSTRT